MFLIISTVSFVGSAFFFLSLTGASSSDTAFDSSLFSSLIGLRGLGLKFFFGFLAPIDLISFSSLASSSTSSSSGLASLAYILSREINVGGGVP
jgi:hypothetical protein